MSDALPATVGGCARQLAAALRAEGLDAAEARAEAQWLLCHCLGLAPSRVYAHPEARCTAPQRARLAAALARRLAGEPMAYVLGERDFWTFTLHVDRHTLIPRADTETLVEAALALIDGLAAPRVLDLGTGSGAVALAIATERRDARVEAGDCSAAALAVARANAARLGLAITAWHCGDWFAPLAAGARFELIVSNPPYLAAGDRHWPTLGHEPRAALCGGADGLSAIRALIAGAPAHLAPGGALALEHGHEQGPAVASLLRARGYTSVQQWHDLGRRCRVSAGRPPQSQ